MAWFVLIVAGLLEVAWASMLPATEGLSRPGPTVAFLVLLAGSMILLARATETIPIGTAYAVWTGVGAVLTVAWAALTGVEPLTPLKVLFLAGIIGCAAGLKFTTAAPAVEATQEDPPQAKAAPR